MVFNKQYGKSVHESHLKGRVDMDGQSLQIKNVAFSDAGSYICIINTFPSGKFESTTKLDVQELKPMPSWYIYVIVSCFLLLLLILSVTAYFFCRRCDCKRGHEHQQGNARICETDLSAGKEEVVYAGVKIKKTKKASSSKTKHEDSAHSDNVIYSHVNVFHQQN
ncbi:uncharacterized protein LOC105355966 isoform X2 [Oryzias latipes]|nr:uncharacterized protein LOC105355966 isoform X2 [Oryzias latipes]